MRVRDFIKSKEVAWRVIMTTDDGSDFNAHAKTALADLRTFCNGTRSTFNSDPLEMARLTGRKEVFERIMTYLHYDYSKLYELEEEIIDND